MNSEEYNKPEMEPHEFSISDEVSEMSAIKSDEFYCLDGGFASHLPTHYKVNLQILRKLSVKH